MTDNMDNGKGNGNGVLTKEYFEKVTKKVRDDLTGGMLNNSIKVLLTGYEELETIQELVYEYIEEGKADFSGREYLRKDVLKLFEALDCEIYQKVGIWKRCFPPEEKDNKSFLKNKIDFALESVNIYPVPNKNEEIYNLRYYILKNNVISKEKEPVESIGRKFGTDRKEVILERERAIIQIALFYFSPYKNQLLKEITEVTPELLELYHYLG